MVPYEVKPGRRNQRRELCHQLQRFKHDMRCAVAPSVPETIEQPAIGQKYRTVWMVCFGILKMIDQRILKRPRSKTDPCWILLSKPSLHIFADNQKVKAPEKLKGIALPRSAVTPWGGSLPQQLQHRDFGDVNMNAKSHLLEDVWVAVQVRTLHEKLAAEHLALRGYECFLPLQLSRAELASGVHYADKSRPLFPGYLFCRYKTHYAFRIVQAPGVIRILGFCGVPSVLPDEEIEAVFRIVNSCCYSEPWPFLQIGQRVRIISGPLGGLEGVLVCRDCSSRVVVSVTLLRRSVAVEVDKASIVPVERLQHREH
jgi:transcriptional antiterminator NusG